MNLKEKFLFGTIIIVIAFALNLTIYKFAPVPQSGASKKDLKHLVTATDSIFTALYYLEKGTGGIIIDPDLRVKVDDEIEIARNALIRLRGMRMEGKE